MDLRVREAGSLEDPLLLGEHRPVFGKAFGAVPGREQNSVDAALKRR